MQDKVFSINSLNVFTKEQISTSLKKTTNNINQLVIVCIGSDIILGDSLGPIVGTMLKQKQVNAYLYGTLSAPITAKDVPVVRKQIKILHPNATILVVDAAVGNSDDVGLIKIYNKGLYPGKGVNKNLGIIGDVSIMGIVQSKSIRNYNLYNLTRLGLVYRMAEQISEGVSNFIKQTREKN